MKKTISGICRVCGCTESSPCVIPVEPGDDDERAHACAWLDADYTLCSNFRCIAVTPLDELLAMAGVAA